MIAKTEALRYNGRHGLVHQRTQLGGGHAAAANRGRETAPRISVQRSDWRWEADDGATLSAGGQLHPTALTR